MRKNIKEIPGLKKRKTGVNDELVSAKSSKESKREKLKLNLEIIALLCVLIAGFLWTITWSGKSPEMKMTLSASHHGDYVVLKSDIEVNKVDFKIETVALRIGEHYRIWKGYTYKRPKLSIETRLMETVEVAESIGDLELDNGSCYIAAAQILNKTGGFTAGDKRTIQCHVAVEKGDANECVPVVLRLKGKRAFPIDVPWWPGEFFSMAVACPDLTKKKETK